MSLLTLSPDHGGFAVSRIDADHPARIAEFGPEAIDPFRLSQIDAGSEGADFLQSLRPDVSLELNIRTKPDQFGHVADPGIGKGLGGPRREPMVQPIGECVSTHVVAEAHVAKCLASVLAHLHPILQTGSPASSLQDSAGHEKAPLQQASGTVYASGQAA